MFRRELSELRDLLSRVREGALSAGDLQSISQKSVDVLGSMGGRAQWLESYVTDDKLFCVYIAESEAAADSA